jgi:hypothetical protein
MCIVLAITVICGWLLQCNAVVVTDVVVVVTLHCHLLMPTVIAHIFQLCHSVLLAAVAHTPLVFSLACVWCLRDGLAQVLRHLHHRQRWHQGCDLCSCVHACLHMAYFVDRSCVLVLCTNLWCNIVLFLSCVQAHASTRHHACMHKLWIAMLKVALEASCRHFQNFELGMGPRFARGSS